MSVNNTPTIERAIPTDRIEVLLKMSNGKWLLLAYQDLVGHKPFIPPNEWRFFSYDASALQFRKGLTLDVPWLVENAKEVEPSAISTRSMLVSEKHVSGGFYAVRLYPFNKDLLGVEQVDDFREGVGACSTYTLQTLATAREWRSLCAKASCIWLADLFDSRKDWTEDAFIDEAIKIMASNGAR